MIRDRRMLEKKVLITGHTGFKGAWLSLLLKQAGYQVSGISLPATPESLSRRLGEKYADEEFFLDIRDKSLVNSAIQSINPHYIFHLAAQPLVRQSYFEPQLTFETNVLGTANILEAALRCDNLKSIGVVTTDKVYLNSSQRTKFDEHSPLGGIDPYSASKAGTEMVVMAWRSLRGIDNRNKAKISSLRAGNVIGGGDFARDRLIPDLLRANINSSAAHIRNPLSTRPWQHVLDPLNGYIKAVIQFEESEELDFNFGPNESALNVNEVVNEVIKILPELKVVYEESKYANDMRESKYLEIDSTRAKEKLNWSPVWNQIEAINRTLQWWGNVNSGEMSSLEACQKDIIEYQLMQTSMTK